MRHPNRHPWGNHETDIACSMVVLKLLIAKSRKYIEMVLEISFDKFHTNSKTPQRLKMFLNVHISVGWVSMSHNFRWKLDLTCWTDWWKFLYGVDWCWGNSLSIYSFRLISTIQINIGAVKTRHWDSEFFLLING